LFTNEKGMAKLETGLVEENHDKREALKNKTPSVILPESKEF
jgi:hypothetical protein